MCDRQLGTIIHAAVNTAMSAASLIRVSIFMFFSHVKEHGHAKACSLYPFIPILTAVCFFCTIPGQVIQRKALQDRVEAREQQEKPTELLLFH